MDYSQTNTMKKQDYINNQVEILLNSFVDNNEQLKLKYTNQFNNDFLLNQNPYLLQRDNKINSIFVSLFKEQKHFLKESFISVVNSLYRLKEEVLALENYNNEASRINFQKYCENWSAINNEYQERLRLNNFDSKTILYIIISLHY